MWRQIIALILVVLASSSIAGCIVGATDYSGYYDKAWGDRVVEKSFRKTTNDRGNDLYVGVVRNATTNYSATMSLEHVKTQTDAAKIYADTVASAKNDGYISGAFSSSDVKQDSLVDRWQGTKLLSYMYVTYYYNNDVKSWVVYTHSK